MTKLTGRNRSRSIAPARSISRGGLYIETGTSVPVAPVWTRATGRELVAIDRARFGKVSCGHGLTVASCS